MNLHMMRDIDGCDPIGGLGPRVTPAPTPAPQPVRRDDGIVVGTDGKLSTDLPLPPGMEPSPWPFPTGAAAPAPEPIPEPEPGAHGFMREPLKVGDKVLILRGATSVGVSFDDVGAVAEVIMVDEFGALAARLNARTEFTAPSGWALCAEDEGKTWERVE